MFTNEDLIATNMIESVVAGHDYLVVYTIKNYTGGKFIVRIGNTAGAERISNGRFIEIITASNTDSLWFDGYWAPQGTVDNVFVCDLTLFPNTGVFTDATGNPWTQGHDQNGKIGGALSFDGSDDHIRILGATNLRFNSGSQDFSIWFWLKRNRAGVAEYLFDMRDGSDDGWVFQIPSSNRLYFRLDAKWAYGGTDIDDTNWHLGMIVVNRAGTMQLYLDNVADGNPGDVSGEVMNIVREDLFIGSTVSPTSFFQGSLDGIGIVDKALSADERDFIWNNGNGTENLVSIARPLVNTSLASGRKGLICI